MRLEQGVEIASVDADVIGDVSYVDWKGIIVLDEFHRLQDIRILSVVEHRGTYMDISGEYGKKLV